MTRLTDCPTCPAGLAAGVVPFAGGAMLNDRPAVPGEELVVSGFGPHGDPGRAGDAR
jgi:hypothetical protein